ncbi:MAG: hypothetical protein BZ136_08200, partial [Methanosphaera sp. rholeuAM74]
KTFCPHWWGKEYETDSGKKTCYFTIDGVKEAYEVSFVPVPAQPTAGTRKAAAIEAAEKEEKAKKEAEALALEAEFYENKFKEVYDE